MGSLRNKLRELQDYGEVADIGEIARRYFGFETLQAKLNGVIGEYADEIKASRKRLKKSKMSYSV